MYGVMAYEEEIKRNGEWRKLAGVMAESNIQYGIQRRTSRQLKQWLGKRIQQCMLA